MVRFLIRNGAKIDELNYQGYTPLGMAACEGKLTVVKSMQKAGANIDALGDQELPTPKAPLCGAAARGQINVVKYLVENGCDVDAVFKASNRSALHYAARGGHLPWRCTASRHATCPALAIVRRRPPSSRRRPSSARTLRRRPSPPRRPCAAIPREAAATTRRSQLASTPAARWPWRVACTVAARRRQASPLSRVRLR